jgi:peptide/nickel transport system permease protein
MATSKRRSIVAYNLRRLANFLGIFARNPRGLLGIVIISVFAIVALFPTLFAPYDPVYDLRLAGYYAAPSWLKTVPADLGGIPNLSNNFAPTANPDFNESLTGWNWTTPPHTSVEVRNNVQDHNEVAYLSFKRDEIGTSDGNVTLDLYQTFYYPYNGPPFSIDGHIVCLFNGSVTISEVNETIPSTTIYPFPVVTVTKRSLDVPMKVDVYVELLGMNRSLDMWPLVKYAPYVMPGLENMTSDNMLIDVNGKWIDSDAQTYPISTYNIPVASMIADVFKTSQILPIQRFFPDETCPGYYKVGVRITFIDTDSAKPVEAGLYLDTLSFETLGTAWGLLGTDQLGRDIWSQLIVGTKVSLYVGLLSSVMAVAIGLVVGLMAGYLGKFVDEFLMRICDVLLVLPGLPLLIVLIAVLGASIDNLIILLGALGWMGFARLVRSQVISLRERPFIEAAKAIGASKTHIMFRHILPNVMALVYVTLATTVPGNIVAEASLGFLGFSDPGRMSWGLMLNNMADAQAYKNWWWVIPPGLCIAAIAIAFILFGYALDEILNPRLRLRR